MDDIFIIQQAKCSQQLLPAHQLTGSTHRVYHRRPNQEGALPFLDNLVSLGQNNTLVTTIYRKPTHTDQYLHWDSNHFMSAKNSVFKTLAFRAKVVLSNQHTLQQEIEHIMKAPLACNFPQWALSSLLTKFNHRHNIYNIQTVNSDQHNNSNNSGSNNKNISIIVPYAKGLSERFKKTCNSLGIQVHFKGNNTIWTLHGPQG